MFNLKEDILKIKKICESEIEENAQRAANNIRAQAIINCEQDILQAKFKHYGVGQPTKIK